MYSLFVVAPIVCWGLVLGHAVLCVHYSFAIISLGEERGGYFTFVVF